QDESVYRCDFEISGKIPKKLFEAFVVGQATLMGVRGYIVKVSDQFKDCYKGVLQGSRGEIECYKKMMESEAVHLGTYEEFVIRNI
ncbi:CG10970, partial [Drosophila busckii]